MRVFHEIEPFYDHNSEILILGSMPSPKSREVGFYYGHPQNRFWKVLGSVFETTEPVTIEEKKAFLRKHKIALWDVISSCEIKGASDSSIRQPIVNDIEIILNNSKVTKIFVVGKTAYNLYNKYILPKTQKEAIYLPSSSAANGRFTIDNLLKEYQQIKI